MSPENYLTDLAAAGQDMIKNELTYARGRVVLIAPMILLLVQCNSFKTSIDAAAGYPVVRVAGEPPQWRLDSLGVLADSGGVGFVDIRDVVIDPRGGALLLTRRPSSILRFDDRGRQLGVVGRVGAGPLEYRMGRRRPPGRSPASRNTEPGSNCPLRSVAGVVDSASPTF